MLSSLVLAASLQAAPPAPAQVAQTLLTALQQRAGVPGLGAAVWHRGAMVWQGRSGVAGASTPRPLRADDRFPLASVSKLVTATLAARLQGQGRLALDAPLPGAHPDAWAGITPRQLAAHTSGLPHYQLRDALRGSRHHATVEAAVRDAVGERALLRPPGQAYTYSSWGYTVLSQAVERAGGRPFLDQAREESGFGTEPTTEVVAHDYSYSWGGAGLAASPAELVRWGGTLLADPGLLAAMAVPARLRDGREVVDAGYRVGLGWRLQDALDGEPLMHHAGSRPDARTALVLWPASGSAAALLANAEWVSFVVASAEVLAAPFRPVPSTLVPRECPRTAVRVRMDLDGASAELPVTAPGVDGGLCRGRLPPGPLAPLVRSEAPLDLVGLDAGLSRAALVTPVGLIELRAQADGSLLGRYGTRLLRLRFVLSEPAPAAAGARAG